jgi:hypothetical protein
MSIDIPAVVAGYITCLLWSESCRGSAGNASDEHEHNTDDPQDCDASLHTIGYDADDLTEAARKEIESDVADFVMSNAADILALVNTGEADADDIGHNFLLSRNGHGTGFWDRGWGVFGDRLHAAAKAYGDTSAYATEDGAVGVDG